MYHHVILSLGRVQLKMSMQPTLKITSQRYLLASKQIILVWLTYVPFKGLIIETVNLRVWFSFQSDSRRTLIWRVPGTHYHQENTIERHRYGGSGWLDWGGIILGSRTDLHV
ncbi:transposable element Tcb1 transposase [Trichonephila clavipes]|nr:transposable element Tcb1 transposase [Trichonephila clavipes]